MGETKAKQLTEVQRFWDDFRSCVEDNGVDPGHSRTEQTGTFRHEPCRFLKDGKEGVADPIKDRAAP